MLNLKKFKCLLLSVWIILFSGTVVHNLFAQSLSLSLGAAAGYAPILNYGSTEKSGAELALLADLEYGRIIGRLQFTYVLAGTVNSSSLRSGYAFHGSLGYNARVSDQIFVPIMLTGGIGIISYTAYGSSGTQFDAGPQLGLTIAPYYKFTDQLSAFLSLRYIKGFIADRRSDPIDMADVLIGIRYTLN